MQRVGHRSGGAEQVVERAAVAEADLVALGEDDRMVLLARRHAVVHPARQVTDLRVQGAAESDVHLLDATADAEHRLAGGDHRPSQRQHQIVAAEIERAMPFGLVMAIEAGVDVGPGTGQDQAVEQFDQLTSFGGGGQAGQDQRQAAGDCGHSLGRAATADLRLPRVVDLVQEGGDADQWAAGHERHSIA